MQAFAGQAAVVTGGGTGVGAALALALAGAGATVHLALGDRLQPLQPPSDKVNRGSRTGEGKRQSRAHSRPPARYDSGLSRK